MYTIQSPIEGFNGVSTFGSTRVEFKDGKAEIPDLNLGLKTYLKVTGYKIAGKAANDRTAAQQKKLDAAADEARAKDAEAHADLDAANEKLEAAIAAASDDLDDEKLANDVEAARAALEAAKAAVEASASAVAKAEEAAK